MPFGGVRVGAARGAHPRGGAGHVAVGGARVPRDALRHPRLLLPPDPRVVTPFFFFAPRARTDAAATWPSLLPGV
ncbi:MAG: hypothetical protein CL862_03340 [Cyanobium sp. NAT70]|nr:hypothetical protein [Cyanobium sp. NAT70]